ncbi:transmembrane protein, putative (macronuclear) [Tetrahymena thermophila SB210]|uniref:Transmembrane protein, putative n=1 Tax=Tetrahymena thermophila (strain SB210) TaxID=312017 RepID=W7X390_TETTS|nr:transmembrane protein, putative [Tetrahymena thermophila SB210]EWS73760.1 transmembrane protein, putative [Tetrahymena thermophila SB210]|eukprot:XP_012653724.1 transmembrane protein, putative [Tetrahymena thermophila SB210]
MSQRNIQVAYDHSPQRQKRITQFVNKGNKVRRNREQDRHEKRNRKEESESSSQSSSKSSSRSSSQKSSSSSGEEENNKNKRQSRRDIQKATQARKSVYLQQEKLRELQQREKQEKTKIMIMKSQKKIDMQENKIEDLQQELEYQKQNVDQLNKERQKLKQETQKIQMIEQQKNLVQSNYEAHKLKVETVKKNFMKRQQTQVDIKADNFNKALHNDQSKVREVGNTILFIFNQLFFALSNNYFLSKYVYQIANSYGAKSEVFFSKNAFLFNNYLFSVLIFIPFYVEYFINTKISGIDSFFLHNYAYSTHSYVSVSLAIFFLFQLIVGIYKYNDIKKKEVGQEAKKSKKIINFRIVFGDWNWKIRERDSIQKNQISLTKRVLQYYSDKDSHYKKYMDQNAGLIQKLIFRFLIVGLIISSIVPVIIIHQKDIFFDLVDIKFISEIINGLIIACISKMVYMIIIPLNKFEGLANQDSRTKLLYLKKFFSEIFPILASILMSYSVILENDTYIFYIGILTNNISYDYTKYVCRESQVAYQLFGLLIGHFIISIVFQYIPSILNSIMKSGSKSKFEQSIQFDTIDASISLLVSNTIFLALLPFSFFSIFAFLVILLLNFLNEWLIQQKITLPQFSGLSSTHLKGFVSFFYNTTLLFCFCYYSFFFVRTFTPIYHFDNNTMYCNPFMGQTTSLANRFRQYLYDTQVIGVAYDILTWLPLIYGLFIIYLVAYLVSQNQKRVWEFEFQKKLKELSGIKQYYESRINRLEKRIDDANKILEEDAFLTQENDDYNINNGTTNIPHSRIPQKPQLSSTLAFLDQEDQNIRQGSETSIKLHSLSKMNRFGNPSQSHIAPTASSKLLNQYLTTDGKDADASSKENINQDLNLKKNNLGRPKNFF